MRNSKVTYTFVTQKLHIMENEIKYEWIYDQSPGLVWEYLTQPELLALWLMPNDFRLQLGHEFKLHTKPMPELGLDGIFHCEILTIEPLKKLVYSWKAGPGNREFTMDTICEWTLEPMGQGTKLFLRHSGFKESNIDIFKGMTAGWVKKSEKLLMLMEAKDQVI